MKEKEDRFVDLTVKAVVLCIVAACVLLLALLVLGVVAFGNWAF